jgi:ABC-type transport system involved in multi-copper enzyme maturation permease subunit
MSTPEISLPTPPADPAPAPDPTSRPPGPSRADTWRISGSGLRVVMQLELRQRVRSTRWVLALAVWTLVIAALTTLIWYATDQTYVSDYAEDVAEQAAVRAQAGRTMFGVVVFMVLGLGSLVAPALSATSINGDRAAGVLATLQTTLLTPAELVLGKLLAAWTTSLALLVTAVPFIGWAYVLSDTPVSRLLVVLLVLVLLLLVVCSIGLGWSAVTARPTSSAVLTYLSVAFLGLGLPLLFLLSLPLSNNEERVRVLSYNEVTQTDSGEALSTCAWETQKLERLHTERTWWILAANPFVVVADSAPGLPDTPEMYDDDPLSAIRTGVRQARLGPPDFEVWCDADAEARRLQAERDAAENDLAPTWPVGLALNLGVAAGFTVVAVRRLQAPSRKLPRGVRVA